MSVSLDHSILDQLNTTEARTLHDITDKLTACGVGKIVNLPQIIVVGEQSAGKSSVLEAISRVRFPTDGLLCTRFATELVLRQAKETRADVSVRFADTSKAPSTFAKTGFSEDSLPDIIKDAKERMGLSVSGRDFSKDVLRLEIEGPSMYPLTLVDLPGFYQVGTDKQTEQGKTTVAEIVESYIKQKNSIILVVVPATTILENQVALDKVRKFDPKRERTLGVITKPDAIRPGWADEKVYMSLAKNQESTHKLKHGWHVLRNRAEDEDSLDERDSKEAAFFQESAWSSIPQQDRGIVSLRKKLSKVLYLHIRSNLPTVVNDIETSLRERKEEIDKLGEARSTTKEMKTYLLSIAVTYQRLARDAIDGRYNEPFFGTLEDSSRKLRAQLRQFSRVFDSVLRSKGSKYVIARGEDAKQESPKLPIYLQAFLEDHPYDFPDPKVMPLEDLDEHLQQLAASNQGRELASSVNQDLCVQLFRSQAMPWKEISSFHIRQVALVAKAFVDELFQYIVGHCDDNVTTQNILNLCVDPFFAQKEELLAQKLTELLRPYIDGYAMPLDTEINRIIARRETNRLKDLVGSVNASYLETQNVQRNKQDSHAATHGADALEKSEHREFGTRTVIDVMQAYYETCRRTFTDNIINLAIESCLVVDLPEILTPTQVDAMSDERLKELAAESEAAQLRRQQLHSEAKILEEGLLQCLKYKKRGITVVPSSKPAAQLPSQQSTSSSKQPAPSANSPISLFGSYIPASRQERGPRFGDPGYKASGFGAAQMEEEEEL